MFLDDELIKMCEETTIETHNDILDLYKNIIKHCHAYITERIKIGMPKKEAKTIIDKSFKLFDLFVEKALRSNNSTVKAVRCLVVDYPFRDVYFKNDKLKAFYNDLN